MLEKAKCWNQSCFGLYGDHEICAVHEKRKTFQILLILQHNMKVVLIIL